MSIIRCPVHDVFWDSEKHDECILCAWVTHVDPTQLSTDHPVDDPPACASTLEQN